MGLFVCGGVNSLFQVLSNGTIWEAYAAQFQSFKLEKSEGPPSVSYPDSLLHLGVH